jgi:transcriptional antiterminator RfaH
MTNSVFESGSKACGNWYLVYTKPKQEGIAEVNLERQGFTTYVPKIRVGKRKKGRYMVEHEPLFPRYLFIFLNVGVDNFSPIRSTTGVTKLVSFGTTPAQVPSDLVAALKSRESTDGLQQIDADGFEPGERVSIQTGPFAGYEGIFLNKTARERVTILLDIVDQHLRLSMDRSAVQRLTTHQTGSSGQDPSTR